MVICGGSMDGEYFKELTSELRGLMNELSNKSDDLEECFKVELGDLEELIDSQDLSVTYFQEKLKSTDIYEFLKSMHGFPFETELSVNGVCLAHRPLRQRTLAVVAQALLGKAGYLPGQ